MHTPVSLNHPGLPRRLLRRLRHLRTTHAGAGVPALDRGTEVGGGLLLARRPLWLLPAGLGSAPAPCAAREAGEAVLPSSMPGAPHKYRHGVLFLSKRGVWGLLGPQAALRSGRPSARLLCHRCVRFSASPTTTSAHRPHFPALAGPNAAACLVPPFFGSFPVPVRQPEGSVRRTFPYVFSLRGAFPVGFHVWLLRRADGAGSRGQ